MVNYVKNDKFDLGVPVMLLANIASHGFESFS